MVNDNSDIRGSQIVRSLNPKVFEYDFALKSYITPAEEFYVRNHFPQPQIDRDAWRLSLDGCVNRRLELTYKDLLQMPARTVVATLECAGNNRLFLVPPGKGVQWGLGGISNGEWTGVPLPEVLEQAGLQPQAVDVIFEGADSGEVELAPRPAAAVQYSRSLPIRKALDPDVLLCYRLNGKELSNEHGYPLRLIVPGWYAMASVKWLTRITLDDRPYGGYFQTTDYAFWDSRHGRPVRVPISQMLVKAEIARPRMHETIPLDSDYQISGAAWAGDSNVAKVEISTDSGSTWAEAQLVGTPVRNSWRFFQYSWHTASKPGVYTILARATDESGKTQPVQHNPDHGSYMINHCLPIPVKLT
jgi:DMSO/TMAO reductase YedYZ molybdopterin-dependent catalytic subunit